MKEGIHPKYVESNIVCACGAVHKTFSTKTNLKVDVCSNCHPFYTGEQRIMDTAGRVDKFMKKLQNRGR
jgi:large subunit ribosomal protein L31